MNDDAPVLMEKDVSPTAYTASRKRVVIQLSNNLLRSQLGNSSNVQGSRTRTELIHLIFSQSEVFYGYDELIWGAFIVCVYRDPQDSQLSCILIDKVGVSHFTGIDTTKESRYYPAVENIAPIHRNSESRQCIAVTFLMRFAQLTEEDVNRVHPSTFKFDYDPTHAGDLASFCTELNNKDEIASIGSKLASLGLFRNRLVSSVLLDVVYEHNERDSESNNKMVFHLGKQLEQLFNPLTEYSPEHTEYTYKTPAVNTPSEEDDALVKAILNELLELQTNFTLNLVEFLQNFVITLRVQVLNGKIYGLSTIKLNRLFPPTIDEVTRINCIFLDSLRSAIPFGSLEVLKACSITIPYFYKAYTRHEAATKHFNKDIKLFLTDFNNEIPYPDVFTEMKIDTLIKGPQEKLMKIKLIVDRLYSSKKWNPKNCEIAKRCYDNVVEVIDCFGKLTGPLSSYDSRIFTPSGRVLTELAEGWPAELQYKSFKRRLVGVFDLLDPDNRTNRKLLVIFSDYLIFLDILEDRINRSKLNKPSLSDVFMNSLVNEVPLPSNIPRLKVSYYSYIDDILVTPFDNESLRFDAFRGHASFAVTLMVRGKSMSAYTLSDLVTKAKILEKSTAFHLFKAIHDNITIYSTAHEREAYSGESIKSSFTLFLNIEPTREFIMRHKLHVAMFAKFIPGDFNTELVQLDILTSDGGFQSIKSPVQELIPTILHQLSFEIPVCFSSVYSPLVPLLLAANESIVKSFGYFNTDRNSDPKLIDKNIVESGMSSSLGEQDLQHGPKESHTVQPRLRNNSRRAADDRNSFDRFDFEERENSKHPQLGLEKSKIEDEKKVFPREAARNSLPQESQHVPSKLGKRQKKGSISSVLKSIFGSKKKSADNGNSNSKNKNKPKTKPGQEISRGFEKDSLLNRTRSDFGKKSKPPISKPDIKMTPFDRRGTNELSILTQNPTKIANETRHLSLPLRNDFSEGSRDRNKRYSTASTPAKRTADEKNNRDSIVSKGSATLKAINGETGENSSSHKSDVIPKQSSDDTSGNNLSKDSTTVPMLKNGKPHEVNQLRSSQDGQLNNCQSTVRQDGVDPLKKSSPESRKFDEELFGDVVPRFRKNSSPSNSNKIDTTEPVVRDTTVKMNDQVKVPAAVEHEDFSVQKNIPSLPTNIGREQEASNKRRVTVGPQIKPRKHPGEKIERDKDTTDFSNTSSFHSAIKPVEERPQKNAINTRVQKLKASKIDFERSPSFVQLFQGMRLVLDESDAKYNWKRLPSEYSLLETSPVNRDEKAIELQKDKHRPNTVREGERQSLRNVQKENNSKRNLKTSREECSDFNIQGVSLKNSVSKTENRNTASLSMQDVTNNAFVSPTNPTLCADNASLIEMHEQPRVSEEILQKEVPSKVEVKTTQNSKQERPITRKASTFKVVNRSPTRIVSRSSPGRPASPYNVPSDISIISDLEGHVNQRLFELKFPSKDDLKDSHGNGQGVSPTQGPTNERAPNVFAKAVEYVPRSSRSPVGKSDDSKVTPDNPLNFPKRKESRQTNTGLLEELNFGSFNVSFDHFNKDPDISETNAVSDHQRSIMMKGHGPLPTTLENPGSEEPLIYRLSTNVENSPAKTDLNKPRAVYQQLQKDDDPIWVSPSKLDYYDISKLGDTHFKDTEQENNKRIITTKDRYRHRRFAENAYSMRDLSYSYLASVIGDGDDNDDDRRPSVAGDKPVRLTFKE